MALTASTGVRIVAITGRDWRPLRDLRLQALADSPNTFMETLVQAAVLPDEEWQTRARRCEEPDYTGFAAIDQHRWVGTMRCAIIDGHGLLQGVFVAPTHRGGAHGVADKLLDSVEQWARDREAPAMVLDAHEDNLRAQAFYRRRGYAFSGQRQPYPLVAGEFEVQMRRRL